MMRAEEFNLPDAPFGNGMFIVDDHYEISADFFKK